MGHLMVSYMGRGSHTETFRYLDSPISKLWVVDNILPEHVELPHVLDLAVHLVKLCNTNKLTHRYLSTPTPKSYGFLITFSLNM